MKVDALLTEGELYKITGSKVAEQQIRALKQNGIPFVRRLDGKPAVSWGMVNRAQVQSAPVSTAMNLAAI